MQGTIRKGTKKVAKMTLRVQVRGMPSDGSVEVTDLMFQPGGSSSGWMPHVTELPWSAGVSEDTQE